MGKVKPRVRTSKGKKWRKGQSGSSNPQTKKHRDAAKGKFGNHLSQVSITHYMYMCHNGNLYIYIYYHSLL